MPKTKAADACCSTGCEHRFDHNNLDDLMAHNKKWAASMKATNPEFFTQLNKGQAPEFLYIGCADSRVPANQIMGLAPGEVFVQRNVGNQAGHTDMNVMACIEYAVKSLGVKTILVCGHYNCGAVRAALTMPARTPGVVNCWISDIREARNQAAAELAELDEDAAVSRLCELNVMRQVFNVCTSPVVQEAWADGKELHVQGLIFDLKDGILHRLTGLINNATDVYSLRFDGGSVKAGVAKPAPAKKATAKAAAKAAPAAEAKTERPRKRRAAA
ncbi:carbonic anhydrase [Raphidocelis subcapitata]|uniref:Carbonic anhydrase n=1 Tax=Raphidocelis subcapitata TaxID=307507 RepID=A0A2V0PPZ5_9CHLO|nr:carbonic anhydrase [Raphidocelis subcapitata]|eukprot:GBG00254.1 carbonic anhydrase [Raphidocelis subcapitata]